MGFDTNNINGKPKQVESDPLKVEFEKETASIDVEFIDVASVGVNPGTMPTGNGPADKTEELEPVEKALDGYSEVGNLSEEKYAEKKFINTTLFFPKKKSSKKLSGREAALQDMAALKDPTAENGAVLRKLFADRGVIELLDKYIDGGREEA